MSVYSFGSWRPTTSSETVSCAYGDGNISGGIQHYESSELGLHAHKRCIRKTKAAAETRLLDSVRPMSDPEVYSTYAGEPSPRFQSRRRSQSPARTDYSDEGQPSSFWARHKGKIILGTALVAGVALVATKVLSSSAEEWHQFCLQSMENANDLWCCAKQVSADAASCLYQRFESANFWTPAGDPERLALTELPKHGEEPFIHNSWTVTVGQQIFRKIFG
ncbi:MAG: hypothetical protein K1X28_05665 [Parachlamydiales bacterium]|nr:hypothetical protein [Parachlamydiales bacterium]